ncbi:hypothetical protein AQUCO_00600459v1 [Aquilegia coerulea]|uniref:Uncharacterized protein n=1 Tax=Aquilegia coerulea TaxID=218851 RepID=A0A2G5EPT4_AQUCA|nr:hypothetical protein AQUCO_00600459v1 [Aquilegia coerulea]PIA57748.1 hypothetical protein AQUCO_00600459v1 [Aquilegia coerulea]
MGSIVKPTVLCLHHITSSPHKSYPNKTLPVIRASSSSCEEHTNGRRKFLSIVLMGSVALGLQVTPTALAENWGTRSFLREHFFEPGLSPEDAAARIKQTAEGLHSIREMLETTSWRYVIFYIRLKSAYLNQDLKNVMTIMPENKKASYVEKANELVDNMAEFDYYVRTPKIYESYVYYEKTLKSLDDIVALLA